MLEGARQKRTANSVALAGGTYEQLRQEPEITCNPAEGEADDFPIDLGHPEAIRIVLQRKQLKIRGPDACNLAKAVTFREIVDAAHDQLLGSLQFLSTRGTDDRCHAYPRSGEKFGRSAKWQATQ